MLLKRSQFKEEAERRGYTSETWVITEVFPTTPLQIGYGYVWSDQQQAWVIGCTDQDHEYYTAVPIYYPEDDEWAKIIDLDTWNKTNKNQH